MSLLQEALRAGVRDAVTHRLGRAPDPHQSVERVGETITTPPAAPPSAAEPREARPDLLCRSPPRAASARASSPRTSPCCSRRGTRAGGARRLRPPVRRRRGAARRAAAAHVGRAAPVIDAIDTQLMDGFLATHEPSSLARALRRRSSPPAADRITAEQDGRDLRVLRTMFDYVIVDLPPSSTTSCWRCSKRPTRCCSSRAWTSRASRTSRSGSQTLDLLAVAGPKMHLVLNRANAQVKLDIARGRAGARRARRVPHPDGHRGAAVGQRGHARGARQAASAAGGARAASRSPTVIRPWTPPRVAPRRQARPAARRIGVRSDRRCGRSQQYNRWQDMQQQPGVHCAARSWRSCASRCTSS